MGIYQDIWDADQEENGVRALRKKDQSNLKDEAVGYVIVDEEVSGDDANVISEVFIPPAKRETYDLCERLFDNYILNPGIREMVTEGESLEERNFIRAIIPTKPMQVAKEFIARDLGQTVTDVDLAVMIEKTWFFQGTSGSKFASGFEHIFVGEQKDVGEKPDLRATELGGYHYWYKYYLDDGGKKDEDGQTDDQIRYISTRYENPTNTAQGILVPEVITLSYEWTAPDIANNSTQLLNKPTGGFWVGCSPEGLMALGLVKARTSAGSSAVINGATYEVVSFPLDGNPQSIRTFFPKFKRADFIDISPGNGNDGGDGTPITDGTVKIMAALVNLSGDESGRETVTLLNIAPTAVNLDNWKIKAPNGWEFTFADVTIGAGESRSFRMVSSTPQFSNQGGTITLLEPDGTVHDRVTYTREQVRREDFTITF